MPQHDFKYPESSSSSTPFVSHLTNSLDQRLSSMQSLTSGSCSRASPLMHKTSVHILCRGELPIHFFADYWCQSLHRFNMTGLIVAGSSGMITETKKLLSYYSPPSNSGVGVLFPSRNTLSFPELLFLPDRVKLFQRSTVNH